MSSRKLEEHRAAYHDALVQLQNRIKSIIDLKRQIDKTAKMQNLPAQTLFIKKFDFLRKREETINPKITAKPPLQSLPPATEKPVSDSTLKPTLTFFTKVKKSFVSLFKRK